MNINKLASKNFQRIDCKKSNLKLKWEEKHNLGEFNVNIHSQKQML